MSSDTLCSCDPKHYFFDDCPNVYLLKCSICYQYGHTKRRCPNQVYASFPSAIPRPVLEATGLSESKDLEKLCILLLAVIKKHHLEHEINSEHALATDNLREEVDHIQEVLQSAFKSEKALPIRDIENVYGQINGLKQIEGDSLHWRCALSLCLAGKIASKFKLPIWTRDKFMSNDGPRALLRKLDLQTKAVFEEILEQKQNTDTKQDWQRLQSWKSRLFTHLRPHFYPDAIATLKSANAKSIFPTLGHQQAPNKQQYNHHLQATTRTTVDGQSRSPKRPREEQEEIRSEKALVESFSWPDYESTQTSCHEE